MSHIFKDTDVAHTDTWFTSGQVSAFSSTNSNCDSQLPGETLLIFSCFGEVHMTTFPGLFIEFFFSQLSNPTFSFPLLPIFFFFLFPYCDTLLDREQCILNVFQVSAQQCISYLRAVELQQAAAPEPQSLQPHPHPPSVWSVSSLVHLVWL